MDTDARPALRFLGTGRPYLELCRWERANHNAGHDASGMDFSYVVLPTGDSVALMIEVSSGERALVAFDMPDTARDGVDHVV